MANNENLIPFNKRTVSEQRKIQSAGGKASGEARRRKADFRKTLNMLLTAEIDSEEWKPVLEALGVECTLESALNMAMIRAGLAGDVKAMDALWAKLTKTSLDVLSYFDVLKAKYEEKHKIATDRPCKEHV